MVDEQPVRDRDPSRDESDDRDRLAPPGSPGGAAAVASLLWGLVAYVTTGSLLAAVLVALAALTTLEAIAGFTSEWLE
ncbi:hypothetical protein [Haloterrigena salinisoli]|uniref:hypothetical protein n=1 Tax=Haloterrigena salinisoli TaxID=3132747 RepID=UPI0030CE9F43